MDGAQPFKVVQDTSELDSIDVGISDRSMHGYTLEQNYPNPLNSATIIKYYLPKSAHVRLTIFDFAGKEEITLLNQIATTGEHQVTWNGDNNFGQRVTSGIYFYQLKVDDTTKTRKLAVIR